MRSWLAPPLCFVAFAGVGPARVHQEHAGEADLDLRLHAGGRAPRRVHRGRGGVAGGARGWAWGRGQGP